MLNFLFPDQIVFYNWQCACDAKNSICYKIIYALQKNVFITQPGPLFEFLKEVQIVIAKHLFTYFDIVSTTKAV